ncbi:uncharacterized protein [Battus philenor]|uniref:uncharacterized protein n=1 Tax=Battus philenor TaxID=42288 RepID=UPI0035CFF6D9
MELYDTPLLYITKKALTPTRVCYVISKMTSDQSVTSACSRVRQFGLYRTIDARTEEFLRLSRKRQIRQGCACAAVSTAITVTVIVVVLLIYEYAIAVETSLVPTKRSHGKSVKDKSVNLLKPIADRLDRNYFGFDQEYYERMPLLVNALAENINTVPNTDTITQFENRLDSFYRTQKHFNINQFIQKTSPSPFKFEQKSSTTKSFENTYGSKSWVESYRNAQRMKNLQQILIYLGKTFNAKLGDIYTMPSRTHIAFSGVYIEPVNTKYNTDIQNSNNPGSRHRFDPLFTFKPDNPSDVNLLAEDFLTFLPSITNNQQEKHLTTHSQYRTTSEVQEHSDKSNGKSNMKINSLNSSENIRASDFGNETFFTRTYIDTTKFRTENQYPSTQTSRKNYITTAIPIIQFKSKLAVPIRRSQVRNKIPLSLPETNSKDYKTPLNTQTTTDAKKIVNVNVYPTRNIKPYLNVNTTPSTKITSTMNVEDYHAGSSGVIPVTTQATIPDVTSKIPFLSTPVTVPPPTWPTDSPDVIKFSREDAKIPTQYLATTTFERTTPASTTESIRRECNESLEYDENKNIETRTLVIKLLNNHETTTRNSKQDYDDTTANTYVPHVNGHYRNIEQNSRKLLDLLKENSEKYRRNRLKSLTTVRVPIYVPMYVEIKRNRTRQLNESSDQ